MWPLVFEIAFGFFSAVLVAAAVHFDFFFIRPPRSGGSAAASLDGAATLTRADARRAGRCITARAVFRLRTVASRRGRR